MGYLSRAVGSWGCVLGLVYHCLSMYWLQHQILMLPERSLLVLRTLTLLWTWYFDHLLSMPRSFSYQSHTFCTRFSLFFWSKRLRSLESGYAKLGQYDQGKALFQVCPSLITCWGRNTVAWYLVSYCTEHFQWCMCMLCSVSGFVCHRATPFGAC